ncbi:hypothetical protein DFH11DRAFT_1547583 [Phellopilus nigrolimitatus]|nr:hypothetical protein DFH11DRAFT_1547583 [Phellopilus nigrolimitatus]
MTLVLYDIEVSLSAHLVITMDKEVRDDVSYTNCTDLSAHGVRICFSGDDCLVLYNSLIFPYAFDYPYAKSMFDPRVHKIATMGWLWFVYICGAIWGIISWMGCICPELLSSKVMMIKTCIFPNCKRIVEFATWTGCSMILLADGFGSHALQACGIFTPKWLYPYWSA